MQAQRAIAYPPTWVDSEDQLILTSFNSVSGLTLIVQGRFLSPDGVISRIGFRATPNSDRSVAYHTQRIGAGWILSLLVSPSISTLRRGQCFAELSIVRSGVSGGDAVSVFCRGYVVSDGKLAWPGQPLISPLEGPGAIGALTGTDPAAGAEISQTVPTNARWRPMAVYASLVTDATVADRYPTLTLDNGTTVFFRTEQVDAHAAGVTRTYCWSLGYPRMGAPSILVSHPLPIDIVLPQAYRIRTATANIQAGDNWGAPQLYCEEWIEE